MLKGEILLDRVVSYRLIFVFWSILLADFSRIGHHLTAKFLEHIYRFSFLGKTPYKFRLSTPPPHPGGKCNSFAFFNLISSSGGG